MKIPPETEHETLLDATLVDDHWQEFNESLRGRALAAFHGAQRRRRWQWHGILAALVAVALAGGMVGLRRLHSVPTPIRQAPASTQASTRASSPGIRYVNGQELLAMFPKGSCVIAEINGQQELVVLDPTLASQGFKYAPEVGR